MVAKQQDLGARSLAYLALRQIEKMAHMLILR